MLDQSITRTLIPPPHSRNGGVIKPANLATRTGLDFGSEAYRRHLSARIAHARGGLGQHAPSARGTGLSKTLSKTARQKGSELKPQPKSQSAREPRDGEASRGRALRAVTAQKPPSAPLGRMSGRRPRMVVRITEQADLLGAR
jgi:hypothetical protein